MIVKKRHNLRTERAQVLRTKRYPHNLYIRVTCHTETHLKFFILVNEREMDLLISKLPIMGIDNTSIKKDDWLGIADVLRGRHYFTATEWKNSKYPGKVRISSIEKYQGNKY